MRLPTLTPGDIRKERRMADAQLRARQIVRELEALGDPANVEGMARYGIRSARVLGVTTPVVRAMARRIGRDHELAAALWKTGVLEARAIAALIDDPAQVTRQQMERWVRAFDSWAVCDGVCCNLFDRTPLALEKIPEWTVRKEEYVKRAGFVLMAGLSVHDRRAPDALFRGFLPIIEREANDGRNFVKKAVNWALRQIGKRNIALNAAAVRVCRRLVARPEPSARWIGHDALRELTGATTVERIRTRRSPPPAGGRTRSRPRR
jgi:3-methyladenine DNA glycosylase AlkD